MRFIDKALPFIRNLVARFRDDDVPSLGAQLTYYWILAFFPFMIFVVSVAGFVNLNSDAVIGEMIRLLPAGAGDNVRSIVNEASANRSQALLSVGMLAALWAASNGINAVIKGLNKAYDAKETRPFWKVRGLSLLATVSMAAVIAVSMLTLVFGENVGEYLFRRLDYPAAFPAVWDTLKIVVPPVILFVVFLLLYRIAPNRRLSWREVVPGSLFAALAWIVGSILISFYVGNFSNYSGTYGSLGGIIALLLWLYFSSMIVLLGGEINATLALDEKRGKARDMRGEKPGDEQFPLSRTRKSVY